jgi:HAD superfamily hydrolase (TIGR01490 family)
MKPLILPNNQSVKYTFQPSRRKRNHFKVAIFDIDGTIFRSSLLIELIEALIKEKIFAQSARSIYAKKYENWFNRRGTYDEYIKAVITAFGQNIKGVNYNEFKKVAARVIARNKYRVYCYTRDLIKKLKRQNYYLLAISNSPKEIVQDFCEKLGFDKVYGTVYEVGPNKKFTGKILYADIISDKSKVLKRALEKEDLTLPGSIGVGDSESDIAFFKAG